MSTLDRIAAALLDDFIGGNLDGLTSMQIAELTGLTNSSVTRALHASDARISVTSKTITVRDSNYGTPIGTRTVTAYEPSRKYLHDCITGKAGA